jgi:hypothetical protein
MQKAKDAWQTKEGRYGTLEEVRGWELEKLLVPMLERCVVTSEPTPNGHEQIAEQLSKELASQSEAVLEVLTIGPRSRPSTRKVAGTRAPKKAAKVAVAQAA